MTEYTPTTATPTTAGVRAAYVDSTLYPWSDSADMFDRWLAARDRENRAIGWDEGHTHCFHVENPKNEGNPYRGDT